MKVKLIIRRYPFYSFYECPHSFKFEPKLFSQELTDNQEKEFGDFLANILNELREIREIYYSIKERFNVKFIEIYKEIEIDEEKLKKIIEYAKGHGLKLKPYVEVLPFITEQQFEQLREYAKKYGYKNAIAKFISH